MSFPELEEAHDEARRLLRSTPPSSFGELDRAHQASLRALGRSASPQPFAPARAAVQASQTPPDAAARVYPVRQSDPAARLAPVEVARQIENSELDAQLEAAPGLAEWLQDPLNAAVAKDSVPQLSEIVAMLRPVASRLVGGAARDVSDAGRSLASGAAGLGQGAFGLAEFQDLTRQNVQAFARGETPPVLSSEGAYGRLARIAARAVPFGEQLGVTAPDEFFDRRSRQAYDNLVAAASVLPEGARDAAARLFIGGSLAAEQVMREGREASGEFDEFLAALDPERPEFEYRVFEALGNLAAAVAVTGLTRNPAPMSALYFGISAGDQIERQEAAGVDPAANVDIAAAGGLATAASASLRVQSILNVLPPSVREPLARHVLGRIAQQAAEEGIQETFDAVTQNALESIYNPEAELLRAQDAEGIAAGASAGAILQAIIEAALPGRARGQRPPPSREEAQAVQDAIREVVAQIEAAPVTQRSREAVRDFLESLPEGQQTVLLDAEGLSELFQSDTEIAGRLGLTDEQVSDMLRGTDVEVSVATVLATENGDAVIDVVKRSPEDMTVRQIEQLDQDRVEQRLTPEQVAELAAEETTLSVREEIASEVTARAEAAGVERAVARANGAIAGAVFQTLVDRHGMTPQRAREVFDQLGLVIQGAEDVAAAQPVGEALDQNTPEFRAWFGDSKVVDETGAPLVVYHGTTALIDAFRTPSFFAANRAEASAYTFSSDLRQAEQMRSNVPPLGEPDPSLVGRRVPYFGTISDIERGDRVGVVATDQGVFRFDENGRAEFVPNVVPDYGAADTTPTNMSVALAEGDGARFRSEDARFVEDVIRDRDMERGTGGNVIPAYLSIQNPLELPALEANRFGARLEQMTPEEVAAQIAEWEAQGYDGIKTTSDEAVFSPELFEGETADQWIAFRPEQIKSVFNRGTFDPNDPNILNQEGAPDGEGTGQRRAEARPVAASEPLPDAPRVQGFTGPDPRLVSVAERYARANGIELRRQAEYVDVDEARARRIADAYDAMEHNPSDPAVAEAYQSLIEQTVAQYRALEEAGYRFYFVDLANDPYADSPGGFGNPWNAMRDLRANQTMAVYPTEEGFGSGATDIDVANSPMLADTGIEWGFGSPDGPRKRVTANDLFRAVHDAFGHGLEGAGFRARGEENAWQAHVRLFTGPAVAAITTETRGQNSWLNYGPFGEQNRTAAVEDTVFADQKIGLMPEWTWSEGRAADMGRLPLNEDGTVTLTHWSPEAGLSEIDPAFSGRGLDLTTRSIRERRMQDDFLPRVYFGLPGYRRERGLGENQYEARIDPSRLYDLELDPQGLKQQGLSLNGLENAIRDAGFDGYWNTAQFGPVAVMFDAVSVEPAQQTLDQSAVPFMLEPMQWETKPRLRDVARRFDEMHLERYGRALDPANDQDYQIIVEGLREELAFQLQQENAGEGWYTADIAEALRLTEQIIPQLRDPANRDLFITLAALLSPQQNPIDNWENAVDAMLQYVETGQLPLVRSDGKQLNVTAGTAMPLLRHLIETRGLEGALDFLVTPQSGRELAQIRMDSGVFRPGRSLGKYKPKEVAFKDTVPGIYMFGPKVGDFRQNSSGFDQDAVTVDLWMARTYNRQIGRLSDTNDDAGVVSDVRGRGEREHIKRIVRDLAAEFDIQPSGVQAALWYFEQRLFTENGVASASTSFADAARVAVEKRTGLGPAREQRARRIEQLEEEVSLAILEQRDETDARQRLEIARIERDLEEGVGDVEALAARLEELLGPQARPEADTTADDTLFQPRRASVTMRMGDVFSSGAVIRLTKASDRTSLLHEMAHVYLEMFQSLAAEVPSIAAELDTIRGAVGNNGEQFTREQHERFAEMAEAYYAEGRAPARGLRAVFRRFADWFLSVYRRARTQLTQLTPEARDFFDRMLASDEEIAAANNDTTYRISEAMEGLMTPEEVERYSAAAERQGQLARERLFKKHLDEIARRNGREYRAAKREASERLRAEIAAQPEYVAFDSLVRGEHGKLNREEIPNPSNIIRGRQAVYSPDGDLSLDDAAAIYGFSTGEHLLAALEALVPINVAVERAVEVEMRERFGDMMSDGSMQREAMEAVHNENSVRMLEIERDAVARRALRETHSTRQIKLAAKDHIEQRPLRETAKPGKYAMAARNAHRQAIRLAARGEFEEALRKYNQALFNSEAARLSFKASNAARSARQYLQRFARTKRIDPKKVEPEFIYRIRQLLDLVGQRDAGGEDIIAWADRLPENQETAGVTVQLPLSLLEDGAIPSYDQMSLEQLMDLRNAVRSIHHAGRELSEEGRAERVRRMQAFADEVNARPRQLEARSRRLIDQVRNAWNVYDAATISLSYIWEAMDGYRRGGAVARHFDTPLRAASARELESNQADFRALRELMDKHGITQGELMSRVNEPTLDPKFGVKFETIMAIAFNMGTEGNRQRVSGDQTLAPGLDADARLAAMEEVLGRRLEKRHWDFIQDVWDFIDAKWPEIAALERRSKGVIPAKVDPAPVETPFGVYRGGYYPIAYDLSNPANNDIATQAQEDLWKAAMGGAVAGAQTRQGFTKERVQNVTRPLDLSLGVMVRHITDVNRDLALREVVTRLYRDYNSKPFRDALIEQQGPEVYKAGLTIFQRVASGPVRPRNLVERFIKNRRTNAAVAMLGLSARTALLQPTGLIQSAIPRLGVEVVGTGFAEFLSSPVDTWRTVVQKSAFMRERMTTINRDVRDSLQENLAKAVKGQVTRWGLTTMIYTEMAGVSIPVWMGVYRRAIGEGRTEREAIADADRAIAETQGSSLMMDQSTMQSGTELEKAVTFMFGYFSRLYNIGRLKVGRTRDEKSARAALDLVASSILMFVIPGIFDALLAPIMDDEEPFWQRALRGAFLNLLGSFPGLSGVAGVFRFGGGTLVFDTNVEQAARAFRAYGNIAEDLWDGGEADAEDVGVALRETAVFLGLWFGVPGTLQARRTWRALEKDDPTAWEALVTGPNAD